jgi:uncharacterized repeat protein (TIGR03803 family)
MKHAAVLFVLAATAIPPKPLPAGEIVLHNFACPPRGVNPYGGVTAAAAGNLYGTTGAGGTANAGVVYKLDPNGQQTVLYNFTGGADGGGPYSGVILDAEGNLYGTTTGGGASNLGTVYKVDATGHETVLHSFTGLDGFLPYAGLARDAEGNLYGTTYMGGPGAEGVVYKLDPAGQLTVLFSFTDHADGGNPYSGVILDSAGNLYGTTRYGGSGYGYAGYGLVYKLNPAGQETVLYTFTGSADGGWPQSGVILDSAGNLYGTTYWGGPSDVGVVYKLDSSGNETVLYNFVNYGQPVAGVILDSQGNLYGTTAWGYHGAVVYELDTAGHARVVHQFSGSDGIELYAGVIRDPAGNLYGTTAFGGPAGGVVYKLDPAGDETVLYTFPAPTDGMNPSSGVIQDSAGNLYGTTGGGGIFGDGIVYELDSGGNETVLFTFGGGIGGGFPQGVIRDPLGNLYGTAHSGGQAKGVVYKLDPAGQQTVLYQFLNSIDGEGPGGALIGGAAGNLYGTTYNGGAADWGVVFELSAAGTESVIYSFQGRPDAGSPLSGVIRDSAGNLYGATQHGGTADAGAVFKIDASGHETVLHSFGDDGASPTSGVVRDAEGNLYGTTGFSGTANYGEVYKIDPAGHTTILHTFTGGADGGWPYGGVILDSSGNLYGTASDGGSVGAGVVYMLDPTGQETVLYNFTGKADGSSPQTGLIRDSAGNLYGTTAFGGAADTGVVFQITP